MLIVDTGPILTQFWADSELTHIVRRILQDERQIPVMPPPVAAEVDYMITARGGRQANRLFIRDLADGRFEIPCLEPADYRTILSLNEQYLDMNAGLTDLSVVAMAARYRTTRILTLDHHFRALRPLQGGAFTLLPADEPRPR